MDIEALIKHAISAGREVRMVTIAGTDLGGGISNEEPDEHPEERNDAEIAAEQDVIKLKDWPSLLSISHRELIRATNEGALQWHEKGNGRDARAVMIRGEDMANYIRTCEAVQAGRIDAPRWWSSVRMGEAAEIRETALAMAS